MSALMPQLQNSMPLPAIAKSAFATDAKRWRAVQSRDRAADGVFFTAVRTTGIYCKPSCAARQPNRENVQFFATGEAARQAGFRACKRCRPDALAADDLNAQVVTTAARMIDTAVADEAALPSLNALAERAGFSPFHFHRLFKAALGLTPKAYADAARSRRMRTELAASASVTDAIHGAGYSSASRFYETAQARLGMAPAARRKGGAGERIRYSIASCTLGKILVAATDKGICAIQFGDSAEALTGPLRAQFPNAEVANGNAGFDATVAAVVRLVEAPKLGLDLPLDVRGTAFQERVWRALQAIPPGATASYSDIAAAIGAPKARRAVAQACAANPTAVAIPCHRVLRADGGLSGYRWGAARKAELLKREAAR